MNLEVIRNCLQQRDFKRLFCEGLLWNQVPHDKPIPLTLSKQVFEVVPIAEAGGFVVFMARYPDKKRAPNLALRMRITEQLLLQKFEHLVIFPHKENSQYFCHWFHQKQHQSIDLKLEDLEQSALLFETLTMPLDTPNAPSLSQTLEKMNQLFRRAQRATGGNRMNPVSKAFKHLHEAINQTEQAAKNSLTNLSVDEISRVVEFLKALQNFSQKTWNLNQEFNSLLHEHPILSSLPLEKQITKKHTRQKVENISKPTGARSIGTPYKKYLIPILEIIVEFGGSAFRGEVLLVLLQKMKPILKEADFEFVGAEHNSQLRWHARASSACSKLKMQGLLNKFADHGVWEITEEGRQYLEQRMRGS